MTAAMRRPSLLLALTEPARATLDLSTMTLSRAAIHRITPPGDGQPVLIFPGFMASDRSTGPLRTFLRRHHYTAYRWRLGRNYGPTPRVMQGMARSLVDLHRRHGQPVALVGWSLGGIYARHLAIRHPDKVSQVITLGSPFAITDRSASTAGILYQRLSPLHQPGLPDVDGGSPLSVPATSVYTRIDGIVPWQSCLLDEDERSQNVDVFGSHIGLGYNPAVQYLIADRLARDPWERFNRPVWWPGRSRKD